MNVRDRAPHVLRCGGADPAKQDAIFRIPNFQGHVGGLPLTFNEGTAGKAGHVSPAIPRFLSCFRARLSRSR